jgi:16S rRNA (cytidine1402-2'-O)-methyltransferase
MGYMPKQSNDKAALIAKGARLGQTLVFYDSPNRLVKSLSAVAETMGDDHQVFVAIEMTKMYEKHYRGPVGEVIAEI